MVRLGVKEICDQSEWDAICIGTGICSLAFAAQVVRLHPDARILLIDKHSLAGGYATSFVRPKQGARLDCSLHKLSGMAEGGNLRRILRNLDQDGAIRYVYPEHYFAAISARATIVLPNDVGRVEQTLADAFPNERLGVERFFKDVATHGKDGYFQYQMLSGQYFPDMKALRQAHRSLKTITVAQRFDELFSSSELKNILSAPAVYVGAFPEQISYLYYLHVVYATLNAGNAYVVGSAQSLSDHLVRQITSRGGAVSLSNPVLRILTDDAMRAVGVETLKGRYYSTRIYVNAAPKYAIEKLLQPSTALDASKQKLASLVNSNSTTTLYFFMDGSSQQYALPSVESMVFGGSFADGVSVREQARERGETRSDAPFMEDAYWRRGTMEVTCYQALDSTGGNVVVANVLDCIHHWPERGGAEYKSKKERAKRIIADRVFDAAPGFRAHVRLIEMSTPRTYHRFTNNTDGAGYGALVGTDLSGHGFHYGFPIKGVHFLSSWVAGPGYEAAFGYAEMQAQSWRKARSVEMER